VSKNEATYIILCELAQKKGLIFKYEDGAYWLLKQFVMDKDNPLNIAMSRGGIGRELWALDLMQKAIEEY
jgi:hypothetical protein